MKRLWGFGVILFVFVIFTGCGGDHENLTGDESKPADSSEATEVEPSELTASPPVGDDSDEVQLNSIRLVVTDSTSLHLPDGVYISPYNSISSSERNRVFLGSAIELIDDIDDLHVHLSDFQLEKKSDVIDIGVGTLIVRYGKPPTGLNQLVNIESIAVTVTYDQTTNTYTGSFKGQFSDALMYKNDLQPTATIEAVFLIEIID